jgi:hypothetical protein
MSPVLPDAKTLAGQWTVRAEGSSSACAMEFTLRPVGRALAVEHDGHCLESLRLTDVEAWRPATDGIALATSEGRTVAFFSRSSDQYLFRRPDLPVLVLTRAT